MSAGRGIQLRVTGTVVCTEEWLQAQRGIEVRAKNLVVVPRDQIALADEVVLALTGGETPEVRGDDEETES